MSEEKKKLKKSKRKHDDSADINKNEKKRAKRAEKKALLEQLPKTDDDGIAFTKLQIRRMMKRVKRGLTPIPTKQEEQELKRQEAETRKEDEQVLAGLADSINEDAEGDDAEDNDSDEEEETGGSDEQHDPSAAAAADNTAPSAQPQPSPTRHKKKRSKPVPQDYVCQACKNEHEPAHWIYDCPNKITMKGTNHISKKLKGIHAPDSRKVFVSGLAFDMKKRDVEALFKECGTIVHCKLLTFPDTGRCKGQAYVTFDSDASAKQARMLSGTVIANDNDEEQSNNKKKKGKQESPNKRKDLKLKVTKVLNRTQTKHGAKAT